MIFSEKHLPPREAISIEHNPHYNVYNRSSTVKNWISDRAHYFQSENALTHAILAENFWYVRIYFSNKIVCDICDVSLSEAIKYLHQQSRTEFIPFDDPEPKWKNSFIYDVINKPDPKIWYAEVRNTPNNSRFFQELTLGHLIEKII